MSWIKASACDANACVEVHNVGELWQVRNSRYPDAKTMFTTIEWRTFVEGVKRGEFDPPTRLLGD